MDGGSGKNLKKGDGKGLVKGPLLLWILDTPLVTILLSWSCCDRVLVVGGGLPTELFVERESVDGRSNQTSSSARQVLRP